jgi:hypothetical protein
MVVMMSQAGHGFYDSGRHQTLSKQICANELEQQWTHKESSPQLSVHAGWKSDAWNFWAAS